VTSAHADHAAIRPFGRVAGGRVIYQMLGVAILDLEFEFFVVPIDEFALDTLQQFIVTGITQHRSPPSAVETRSPCSMTIA